MTFAKSAAPPRAPAPIYGDFAEEIAAQLELEADRLVAEGLSRREAVHEAHRRFENVGLVQEDFHRRRTIGWMEAIPQQLSMGALRLVRARVFSITAALTLALGIGATTAVSMGAVALAASWIPARRAAAIDPAATLRTDV